MSSEVRVMAVGLRRSMMGGGEMVGGVGWLEAWCLVVGGQSLEGRRACGK